MRFVLFAVGLAGVAGPAFAQTLIPLFQENVVVTASLEAERRDDLPASVTVVSAEEIRDRQATAVGELLRSVPGLAVVRSGSPGKVTSLFSRGANSNQTLVLWNGVELNDPFGGGFDWAFLPTEGVERVEVVRGPFSALYGGDAVGGVVQVLTGRSRGLGIRLEGGGDGYRRGSVVSGSDLGAVHFDLTGNLRRGDGQVENDSYDAEEGMGRASWAPDEATNLALVFRANDSRVGVPFDFFGTPTPERRQDREIRIVALPFHRQGTAWGIDAQASRLTTDLAFRDPGDPFAAGDTEAEARRARAVASYQASDRLWVAGGADWERQEATSVDAFTTIDGVHQATWAGFGEVHFQARRFTVDAGLRHDDNDAFGAETTARLGAVAALGAGARLRASYGEGFRPPNLVDLYFPGFGNPDLEPERSRSVELGVEGDAGPWRWSLVGFDNDQTNLIVFDFASGLPQNVGRARSRGAEGELAVRRGAFRGRLDATYLDAENLDTGQPLTRRPRHSASLVLTWAPGAGAALAGWTLNAVAAYTGDRTDVGAVELPGYATLDLAAAWSARPWLAPYLRLENLLDRRYEEAAGFPAPGRALVGGLALRF